MKKLLFTFLLLVVTIPLFAQRYVGYQRWGKYTDAQMNAIDTSNSDEAYQVYNTTQGKWKCNTGSGWVDCDSGGGAGSDDQQITDFSLSGNDLSITLENGGTESVDLSPYLDNKNVASGSLSGTDLTLTLSDASTVVVDLSGLQGSAQDLSEVLSEGADAGGATITNIGPPTLSNDAARKADVDAVSISFAGINKTADYTISDAEIGQIHNIIVNAPDSIVVTYPDDLASFGFTTFIVRGTGHVAIDLESIETVGTTGGNKKTGTGYGQQITVRNEDSDLAYVLKPDEYSDYVHVDPFVPIYQGNDAADPINEADAVGANWDTSNPGTATFTSITGGAQNGSYFIELERTGGAVFEQGFSFTTEVGHVYQIDVYMKCNAAAGGTQMLGRTSNGWATQQIAASNTTDTWELETITVTATDTSGIITFKPHNSSAVGTKTGIDNIVITDVTP